MKITYLVSDLMAAYDGSIKNPTMDVILAKREDDQLAVVARYLRRNGARKILRIGYCRFGRQPVWTQYQIRVEELYSTEHAAAIRNAVKDLLEQADRVSAARARSAKTAAA
jgi:hypothetical protein